MASLTAPTATGLGRLRREARRTSGWGGLLYVLPALAILLAFEIWPLVFGIWISLWEWDIEPLAFVGLDNYRQLFGDGFVTRDFRGDLVAGDLAQSLIVTLYYVLGVVPLTILLSFAIAFSLFQGLSGQGILRTVYFLPYVTSSVAMALVFAWMFNPQVGIVNAVMDRVGLPTSTWLREPTPPPSGCSVGPASMGWGAGPIWPPVPASPSSS